MRTHGTGIAKMQRTLHDMGDQVISEFPDIETRGEGGDTGQKEGEFSTVPGEAQKEGECGTAFDKLKEAYVHCRTCEGACYYYTALYVGLTLLRTPATANTESTTHTQLKECVEALDRVQPTPQRFSRRRLRLCVRWSGVLGKMRPLLR